MSEFIVITEHFEGSLLFGIAVLALFVIVPVLHNTLKKDKHVDN